MPALATAGLFAAVLILDLFNRDYKLILGHILLAFVSLLLVLYLCQRNAEIVAWALFVTPFLLIFLGWLIGQLQAVSGKTRASPVLPSSSGLKVETPNMYGYCARCSEYPCLCEEPGIGKPVQDASGNDIEECGPTSSKQECMNVRLLPSA